MSSLRPGRTPLQDSLKKQAGRATGGGLRRVRLGVIWIAVVYWSRSVFMAFCMPLAWKYPFTSALAPAQTYWRSRL